MPLPTPPGPIPKRTDIPSRAPTPGSHSDPHVHANVHALSHARVSHANALASHMHLPHTHARMSHVPKSLAWTPLAYIMRVRPVIFCRLIYSPANVRYASEIAVSEIAQYRRSEVQAITQLQATRTQLITWATRLSSYLEEGAAAM